MSMGPSKSMGAVEETVAGPERVSEGIRREGASIGLFSGSHWPGGCAEQRPSHPLPGEATSAGCCCCRPLPNRAARERHSGPYLCRSPPARRVGTGRGAAGRGGGRGRRSPRSSGGEEGGSGVRCPTCAGRRRDGVAGTRAVAELSPAATGAPLHTCLSSPPPFFFFTLSSSPCPASPGEHSSRSRRPLARGQRCSRFCRPPRRAACSRPAARGVLQRVSLRVPAGVRRRWALCPGRAAAPLVSPREEKPPRPGTGFSAPAAAVRLCGHRGVTEKEAGKLEADCISCAEQHGQTHPIHSIDRRSAQNLIWKREKDLKGVDTFGYEDEYEKSF